MEGATNKINTFAVMRSQRHPGA